MKNFHFDGPFWAFLTPEQMYDEEGKLRRAHKYYQDADIYFMSIMRKCLFSLGKTKVTLDGRIKCELRVGDPQSKKFENICLSFPLAEVWYAVPSIKASFNDRDAFLFHVLFTRYTPKSFFKIKIYSGVKMLTMKKMLSPRLGFRVLRAIYSVDVSIRHETNFEINIFDPLVDFIKDNKKAEEAKKKNPELYALNDVNWDVAKTKNVDYSKLPGAGDIENCRLTVDQVVNYFNIDVGGQRIAYIGKTEQEPFDRLFPHIKLNELSAKLLKNDYETLIIHLFGFKNWDEPIYCWPAETLLSKSDAITIAEAELINYFKPSENDKYVKDEGKSKWNHIELLIRDGYKKISGLLDIDKQYAKFYTSHVGHDGKNRHEIEVDLSRYIPAKKGRRTRKAMDSSSSRSDLTTTNSSESILRNSATD